VARVQLGLACSDYDRTRALVDGTVVPEGIDLQLIRGAAPAVLFRRMLHDAAFDASEMSLSNYLMGLARGDTRFVGLPVFPYRAFRHSMLWVSERSGIRAPRDLIGKRVGVPEYAVSALLYARGMLQHDHGALPGDIHWFRSRVERVVLDLPGNVQVEQLPSGAALDDLLARGELDAVADFAAPRGAADGSAQVRRLFPRVRDVEADYYRRTSIFPIMHLIVLRRDVYERHPWAAASLVKAFQAAKERCYAELERNLVSDAVVLTPWLRLDWEEARAVFGGEIYPYGVQANLPTLEAAVQYSYEQRLSARQLRVEELFAPETLDLLGEHH
jgi:4,5-dihydroxyphthalate decarboxylase